MIIWKRSHQPILGFLEATIGIALLWVVLVFSAFLPGVARAEEQGPTPPPGFQLLAEDIGIRLYRKDYPGGSPDFIQVIDLSQGASIEFMHAPIDSKRQGKGIFGGDDPSFSSQPLRSYWQQITSDHENAFCVTNGSFFYMPEHPTRLPFPLKVDGQIITDGFGGYGRQQYLGQKLMLELWDDRADIVELLGDALYTSSAPNIIAGLHEEANKNAPKTLGRTFVGIDDQNKDGLFEMVLILNTSTATQKQVASVLRDFGADKVMMLDGGGSTQLLCKTDWYIKSERLIPQAVGTVAGSPPPVTSLLVSKPSWPVVLENENVTLQVEVQNIGIATWTPEQTKFQLEASALGSRQRLSLEKKVQPGETAVFSSTMAAFTKSGVYTADLAWGILHEGELYPGEPVQLKAVVLPEEMDDQRENFKNQLDQWLQNGESEIEHLSLAWIEEHTQPVVLDSADIQPQSEEIKTDLGDILWVPLLMLPVMFFLAAIFSRSRA